MTEVGSWGSELCHHLLGWRTSPSVPSYLNSRVTLAGPRTARLPPRPQEQISLRAPRWLRTRTHHRARCFQQQKSSHVREKIASLTSHLAEYLGNYCKLMHKIKKFKNHTLRRSGRVNFLTSVLWIQTDFCRSIFPLNINL